MRQTLELWFKNEKKVTLPEIKFSSPRKTRLHVEHQDSEKQKWQKRNIFRNNQRIARWKDSSAIIFFFVIKGYDNVAKIVIKVISLYTLLEAIPIRKVSLQHILESLICSYIWLNLVFLLLWECILIVYSKWGIHGYVRTVYCTAFILENWKQYKRSIQGITKNRVTIPWSILQRINMRMVKTTGNIYDINKWYK